MNRTMFFLCGVLGVAELLFALVHGWHGLYAQATYELILGIWLTEIARRCEIG